MSTTMILKTRECDENILFATFFISAFLFFSLLKNTFRRSVAKINIRKISVLVQGHVLLILSYSEKYCFIEFVCQ